MIGRVGPGLSALAAVALLSAAPGAALLFGATAAADPQPVPPPVEPAPPPATLLNPLAQAGSAATGPFGLPDLSAYSPSLLLGQNPAPAAPGAADPAVIPNLGAFNTDYLLPQNITPAAPGEGEPAPGIGPDAESPGTGRIAFLRRLHEMYQAGELKGAFLGQLPKDQLDQPLPGTAPAPAG